MAAVLARIASQQGCIPSVAAVVIIASKCMFLALRMLNYLSYLNRCSYYRNCCCYRLKKHTHDSLLILRINTTCETSNLILTVCFCFMQIMQNSFAVLKK